MGIKDGEYLMSMIKDSELGWSCNGDYYVNTAGTVLSTHGSGENELSKTNNGGAIGVEIKLKNSSNQLWYGPLIISTVETYARYTPSASTPTKHITIDGVTWYVSTPNDWGENQEDVNHLLPYLDLNEAGVDQEYIDDITSDSALASVARLIIQAAELTILQKLPNAEYVNKFVKRALIKNNERIVSLIPELTYDQEPTEDSNNLVHSGGIYDFVEQEFTNRIGNINIVKCTQSAYDTMTSHDPNTLYIVLPNSEVSGE